MGVLQVANSYERKGRRDDQTDGLYRSIPSLYRRIRRKRRSCYACPLHDHTGQWCTATVAFEPIVHLAKKILLSPFFRKYINPLPGRPVPKHLRHVPNLGRLAFPGLLKIVMCGSHIHQVWPALLYGYIIAAYC